MIVGIMANGPGAGKSTTAKTIAEILEKINIPSLVCPFADPVKEICRNMGWDGLKDEKGRALLDAVGMAGRAYDPDLWVNLWKEKNGAVLMSSDCVVLVDDVRFPNEVDMLKNLGGKLTFVERKGVERPDLASEGFRILEYDGYFTNNKDYENLKEKIEAWVEVHI